MTGKPADSRRAFLFDVDGVLIDSGAAHNRVWEEWARLRGLAPDRVRRATQGRRRIDTLGLVAPHLDVAEEHALLDRLMAGEESRMRAYDDVPDVLAALPTGSWGVVTSSRGSATARRFARLGLPIPSVRVCAEDVSRGKPDPEGCLTAAARMSVDPAHCVVVEDSPAGVTAGKAAGCTVLAVTTTHTPDQLAHADVCLPTVRAAVAHMTEE